MAPGRRSMIVSGARHDMKNARHVKMKVMSPAPGLSHQTRLPPRQTPRQPLQALEEQCSQAMRARMCAQPAARVQS